MTNPRIAAWICFVCLTALLFSCCATEPADAQPAAAPSPVIETIAPAGDAAVASTPQAPDEEPADLAAEALPEGPDRLAALDDPRGAEGAVLTPDQLAGSASTFAQFTGLEGLTASQPELRQGSPDFLARTIVLVNSQGEQVGMVVAIDETTQIYIWINADGEVVCQYTDQIEPLEGSACDEVVAQYWDAYLAALQEQAVAAESQQTQSWTIFSAEYIASSLADPESKIRDQARFVLGADRLSDPEFATQLGGRIAEITTVVDESSRTNVVVFDGQTNLDDVVTAVIAAREQGLKLLGSTLLYVTHDEDGTLYIWYDGKIDSSKHPQWLVDSYKRKNQSTFMGFIKYNSSDGVIEIHDSTKTNYTDLNMGTPEDEQSKRISQTGMTWQYEYSFDEEGRGQLHIATPLFRVAKFTPNEANVWSRYTLDEIEQGDAEKLPSEEKLHRALGVLDRITNQQSVAGEVRQTDQGASFVVYIDQKSGKDSYWIFTTLDDNGAQVYGPPLIVNNNQTATSQPEYIQYRPLSTQQAIDTINRLFELSPRLIRLFSLNNIFSVQVGEHLLDFHASSNLHYADGYPINSIVFKPDLVGTIPILTSTVGELYEIRGLNADESVPDLDSGKDFVLAPFLTAEDLSKSKQDKGWLVLNGLYNLLRDLESGSLSFPESVQQSLINNVRYAIDFYRARLQ